MAARVKGLHVVFDEPLHAEDAKQVIAAIQMFSQVLFAKPIETDMIEDHSVSLRERVKMAGRLDELSQDLLLNG